MSIIKNLYKLHSNCLYLNTTGCIKKVCNKGYAKNSHDWLRRHVKDQYVKKSIQLNYRARSAFKLIEINKKYNFLKSGQVVVECGAAPGAWTQVVVELTQPQKNPKGLVIGIDLINFMPVEGATILPLCDIRDPKTEEKIIALLKGVKVDVVLSDMCPNVTGQNSVDHERIMNLNSIALNFALKHSNDNGYFLCKIKNGNRLSTFKEEICKYYKFSKLVKPDSSRKESNEMFLFASQFQSPK